MADVKTTPEALASWLKDAFSASEVEVVEVPQQEEYLFRIYDRDRRPFPELLVTLEALEDWDLQAISTDFVSEDIVQWLKQRPSFRLRYGNDRQINHFETLTVRCDGEPIRVVRDAAANVHFYDSADRPIGPTGMRVLPTSIFKKSGDAWCAEIKQLRRET